MVGFTDSDWANDPDDRKSTARYVFIQNLLKCHTILYYTSSTSHHTSHYTSSTRVSYVT